mmetsp:Transcript_125042/g.365194  ORF Transcript_125042/g.365194 Transcript_125042/m.365194 type:complete len:201 (-) Transcript_125042:2454-3056(-)
MAVAALLASSEPPPTAPAGVIDSICFVSSSSNLSMCLAALDPISAARIFRPCMRLSSDAPLASLAAASASATLAASRSVRTSFSRLRTFTSSSYLSSAACASTFATRLSAASVALRACSCSFESSFFRSNSRCTAVAFARAARCSSRVISWEDAALTSSTCLVRFEIFASRRRKFSAVCAVRFSKACCCCTSCSLSSAIR